MTGDFNGWNPTYLTKDNDNHFTGTIDASTWENGKTYEFKFYNEEDGGATKNYWGTTSQNIDFTSNSTCTIDEQYDNGNMTWKHNDAYSSYTVDAEYITNYWHVTITGVPSEQKYTINISAGTGGTVEPSGSQQVGATGITITATPNTGYRFKEWTVNGGASVGSTTSATTTLRATAEGTVTANFELSSTPTPTPSNTDYAYYLVGNFFDIDPANAINYDRHYFKFNIQKDGRYMVEIPAAVTAKAQIIGVTDEDYYKFGPESTTYDIKSDWPTTDQSATGTFAEKGTTNYWNLTTRNDGTHDDDGLYEVWFKVGADGTPTEWEFKHVSTKRVAYFLSDAVGATANPVYNSRNDVNAGFSNKTYAMVYIDPAQKYYTIGYVLMNNENDIISKASAYGAHKNVQNGDILPTTNKLFLLGNGGLIFESHDPNNEVSPNEQPIAPTNMEKATYTVEYNPSMGQYDKAKLDNHLGIRGQFRFIGGEVGGTGADDPIKSVSLVGDPVGTWDYTSTAHDMTYNEKEGCYEITINTTLPESAANNKFRFCANHNPINTWYEDGTEDAQKARVPYQSEEAQGHSCLPTDPNTVLYSTSNTTDNHDIDMIFNRPAGTWTVRLYIDINEQGQKSYRYTITGTESLDIPLTYCCDKFIRTYSNNIAMDLTDDVKAYIAYKFEPAENSEKYGNCKVYLRQMNYIPANVGVVLVGKVPAGGSYSEGYTLNFSLQKRVDAVPSDLRQVWTRHAEYITQNNKWHNFLVPTVAADNNLGNAKRNNNGDIIYRYFGLSNYHSTAYYKSTQSGPDYIGFFRLTANGKSGANKAYLSIPSSAVVGTEGETVTQDDLTTYGCLNFNAQLSGQVTDEDTPSLAKAMLFFDDEDIDDNTSTGITTIKDNIVKDNVYYNMQGIRVVNPTKGIYIFNGKKILVK